MSVAAAERREDGLPTEGARLALLLFTVSLGAVLPPLNSTMLAVALPELREEFSVGHTEIGWFVATYLIAMAVAQPIGGRIGDHKGRSRIFALGLLVFMAFSLGAALAPNFELLVVARTAQALVGAAVIPNGLAMLRETLPPHRLGRATGVIAAGIALAAATGPVAGAALLVIGSWHLLFLVNVPVALLGVVCLLAMRYPSRPRPGKLTLDWKGALAFAAVLCLFIFIAGSLRPGQSVYVLAAALIGFPILGVVFVLQQRSASEPLVEWSLLRNRAFVAPTAHIFLTNFAMYTTIITLPFFFREVQNEGAFSVGPLLSAMSGLMGFVSILAGRLADSHGRRLPPLLGAVLMTSGLATLLIVLGSDVQHWQLFPPLLLLGAGMGLSFGPATAAALEASPRRLTGAAAGTNATIRYLGAIIGATVLGVVLSGGDGAAELLPFQVLFFILLMMAFMAFAAALLIRPRPPEETRAVFQPATVQTTP